MPVTLCRYPKMRLPNQNVNYLKVEPKSPGTGSEAPQHFYTHNAKACAALAAAAAFRSVIEHSQNRFQNLKPGSALAQLVGKFPPAVTAASAFNTDYYDAALMNFMCEQVGCVDDQGNPKDAAAIKDQDFTVSLGRAMQSADDFRPEAGPEKYIYHFNAAKTSAKFMGMDVYAASFPFFHEQELIELLDVGSAVLVVFNFYTRMLDKRTNAPLLDPNNRPIWREFGVGHTVIVNGYIKESQNGTLFRVYDPFGVEMNGSEIAGLKTFVSPTNGWIEHVQFKQLQMPAFLSHRDQADKDVIVISEHNTVTGYEHPMFMVNPFEPAPDQLPVARICVGVAVLALVADHNPPTCAQIQEGQLVGTGGLVRGLGSNSPSPTPAPTPAPAPSLAPRLKGRRPRPDFRPPAARPTAGTVKVPGKPSKPFKVPGKK